MPTVEAFVNIYNALSGEDRELTAMIFCLLKESTKVEKGGNFGSLGWTQIYEEVWLKYKLGVSIFAKYSKNKTSRIRKRNPKRNDRSNHY